MRAKQKAPIKFPSVWGEGNLFALSGFDGKSDWSYPFVGTLLGDRLGFTLHTQREKTCWLALRSGEKIYYAMGRTAGKERFETCAPDIVAGDLISARCGGGKTLLELVGMPLSNNRFLLRCDPQKIAKHAELSLIMRIQACKKITPKRNGSIIETDMDKTFVTTSRKPLRLFVVDSMNEVLKAIRNRAKLRAEYWDGDKEIRYLVLSTKLEKRRPLSLLISSHRVSKIPIKVEKLIAARKSFYASRIQPKDVATLAKAMSILKVNIESPQGVFKKRWTTPDRYPHRHLWLWDSCFHAPAYALIDKRLGEDALTSVLDIQQSNGFIPHIGRPNGDFSNITQPPLLAWSALLVYRITRNKSFLENCYPKIMQYLQWCSRHRDKNGNRLLEWKRSDESGMDNSSRFNQGFAFDAIDFSCIYANDLHCLYQISEELGKSNTALLKKAAVMHTGIRQVFWNARKQFFYDRYPSGRFSPYKTVCGFLPLFSGSATEKQAASLVEQLKDKRSFSTPLPVPSEAIDSPTFDNNMWRGPVWLNYNFFLIQGLRRYGYYDLAAEIRKKTTREVERWYRREGTIFEFYDPFARLSPRDIPRKDTYGAIKEFGWSASLYLMLKRRIE